jgi:hypothetical protein
VCVLIFLRALSACDDAGDMLCAAGNLLFARCGLINCAFTEMTT